MIIYLILLILYSMKLFLIMSIFINSYFIIIHYMKVIKITCILVYSIKELAAFLWLMIIAKYHT